ncbi:MAG: hypothetical protein AAF403_01330, partial [Pseudomonadota bacterium]
IKRWDGRDPITHDLVVMTEQGIGDILHFLRFLPLLRSYIDQKQPDIKIWVQTRHSLYQLLKHNHLFEGFNFFVADTEKSPKEFLPKSASHFIPLLSLPLLLRQNKQFPADPYFKFKSDHGAKWRRQYKKMQPDKAVGLAWFGRTENSRIPVSCLEALNRLKNVWWISLQKKMEDDFLYPKIKKMIIHRYGFDHFFQTAAMMQGLDCVVCNDSAVAHLAGAMGVECHVILPFVYDWRWEPLNGKNQWYPNTFCYYSPALEDWKSPIEQLIKRLEKKFK